MQVRTYYVTVRKGKATDFHLDKGTLELPSDRPDSVYPVIWHPGLWMLKPSVKGKHRVTKRGPALSNQMFTLVIRGLRRCWRAVCVTALQRPHNDLNSDTAAIGIVVYIATASQNVTDIMPVTPYNITTRNIPVLQERMPGMWGMNQSLYPLTKVQQIVKFLRSGTAEGLNFKLVLLELLALSGSMVHSITHEFPFSSWGEALFLIIQTLIIRFLIQHLGGRTALGVLFLGVYFALVVIPLSPVSPMAVITALQATNMPAVIVSRLIQAVTNYRNSHSGKLSAATVALLFLGSLAVSHIRRVFCM
ncbi:unnamed protein product [Ranitomeya imitator]|uniref:Uncharacterized protein n=1 Tax=Ranitomeya imitator TaxID=111125 RepID=A0ABN9LIV2_9NEOB|nr:unnamed protein product [Ranitomeya imitator]